MKKIVWILIGVLLIGGGVVIIKKKKQALARVPPMKLYQQVVTTVTAGEQPILLTLPALAEVRSDQDVVLSSKLSARIISMVKSGDKVKKGQVVVTLDHEDLLAKKQAIDLQLDSLAAELSAQQVALDTELATHKRTKALLDARGASIEQYEAEKSKIASLRAGLKKLTSSKGVLEQNRREIANLLSYAVITAPIDGTVSATAANVGVIAMPGKPLLSIQADSGKYLLVRSADDIHPQAVILGGNTYPLTPLDHTFRGLDEYRADVQTASSSGERLPVRLVVYQGNGILLPLNVLLQKEGQTLCFIPVKGHARAVAVKVVASGTEGVVVEGIDPGQKVIAAQPDILLKLLAGVPIELKQPQPPATNRNQA